jgi:peptidyl-tRNA hydrolase, PTH1 family
MSLLSWIRARFVGAPESLSEPMKVIVGLGNPGKEYEHTRHNVGWWMVDHLAEAWGCDAWRKDGDARVADCRVGAARIRLIKPQTYMNLSGAVLKPYTRRPFWAAPTDLMVIVDEVALPIGRHRFRPEGSAGGHNGLKSIEAVLGNQKYARLRIGISPDAGRPAEIILSDFVLGNFGKTEAKIIKDLLPTLTQALELWITDGILPVMNKYSGKDA